MKFWVGNVKNHYLEVSGWWRACNQVPPRIDMMPEESTLFWEIDGVLAYSVSVFLTNTLVCWVDNYIANPSLTSRQRILLSNETVLDLRNFCSEKGYQKIFCMSLKDSTDKTYRRLGFKPTAVGVTTFILEV